MKHVHADKIVQFAKMVEAGHPIEYVTQSRENEHRQWIQDPEPTWRTDWEYRVALAFVEGKPVFEGDRLYCADGNAVKVEGVSHDGNKVLHRSGGSSEISHLSHLSWTPPEQTISISELLRQVAGYLENSLSCPDVPKFNYTLLEPHGVAVVIGTRQKITVK